MATITLTNGPDDYTDPLGQSNRIEGLDGDDIIHARDGDDVLIGGAGADMLFGGLGDDLYVVDDAGDVVVEGRREGTDLVRSSVSFVLPSDVEDLTLTGSGGIDGKGNKLANHIIGNSGDNVLNIGRALAGRDTLEGGEGNDKYILKNGNPVVVEGANAGTDTVVVRGTYFLPDNFENLKLNAPFTSDGFGNELDNVITGSGAENTLIGGDGNDTLRGGGGADLFEGGAGSDKLSGGFGSDTFDFESLTESGVGSGIRDQIKDFQDGVDQIDLSRLERDTHQNFHFIGSDPFSGVAGELHAVTLHGNTLVEADVNGDGTADFQIQLLGTHSLTRGDFIL